MSAVLILLVNCIFSVSAFNCTVSQMETVAVKGQATILFCDSVHESKSSTYTWTKDSRILDPSPRITIQGRLLCFLNTTLSDNGLYVCRSSNSTFSMETQVFLSVEAGPCPSPYNIELTKEKSNISLSCTEEYIPVVGERLDVQWWKDCKSTGVQGNEFTFSNVAMSSEGNYTCRVIFNYENKNYTVSRTYQLIVLKNEPVYKPRVIQPRNQTLHVKSGVKLKLECNMFYGFGEESQQETFAYWMINDSYAENYPEIQQNLTIEMKENSWLYGNLTLSIPQVLPEFFGIPFQCILLNPVGVDMGQVWLSQDDETNHTWLIIVPLLILAVVVGVVLLNFFKIDLILAYRHQCGKDKNLQEGHLYNGCVFYLHGKSSGSSTAEDLALRILPAMLEQQNNLKLFIQGRDTDPNVSVTIISDVLRRSKAVVLILPGNIEDETLIPLSQGENSLEDSQLAVLFSDMAHSSVPLLLMESDENADYSLLPQSLRSSVKKENVLKWRTTLQPNSRFWKRLRFHMT